MAIQKSEINSKTAPHKESAKASQKEKSELSRQPFVEQICLLTHYGIQDMFMHKATMRMSVTFPP